LRNCIYNRKAIGIMNTKCLVAIAVSLFACSPQATPPLAGARIGGPFVLTGEDGRPVSDADFRGRYRIVYFGYTYCPDVCPTDVANLMNGWRTFGGADAGRGGRIVSLFITVDPARDTPAKLKDFTDHFDPRLIGLTGSAAAIATVAKAYGVAYSAQSSSVPGAYLVDHTNAAYLMDPDGKPLALLPSDGTPAQIASELDKWVR
jgi:protein SCO1